MFELKNKTILILSPESWGTMFISKHHYAIELAKRNNTVYFLNPPGMKKKNMKMISIHPSYEHENLFVIAHRLYFSYDIKFHVISLFHWLMRFHIKKIQKKIKKPLDVVWSFDLGHVYPFHLFNPEAYKIFHPVDEPLNQTGIDSAQGAQIIFSVTKEILNKYNTYNVPKYFINHGVASDFLCAVDLNRLPQNPVRIGFSGNLLRIDIDRPVLLQIIANHRELIFDFWGNYEPKQSNLGGLTDPEIRGFLEELKNKKNVVLHGAVSSYDLARVIHNSNAFLICYDVKKDRSKGTNYHKVMEYLSTGKVIISNNITTYKDHPELVQMVAERENNNCLPELFSTIINNLAHYNTQELQANRIAFALNNSYSRQLDRIEQLLENNSSPR